MGEVALRGSAREIFFHPPFHGYADLTVGIVLHEAHRCERCRPVFGDALSYDGLFVSREFYQQTPRSSAIGCDGSSDLRFSVASKFRECARWRVGILADLVSYDKYGIACDGAERVRWRSPIICQRATHVNVVESG